MKVKKCVCVFVCVHVSWHVPVCFLSLISVCLSCLSCWLALCAAVCTVNATHGGKGKSNMVPKTALTPFPSALPSKPACLDFADAPSHTFAVPQHLVQS